MKNNLWYYVPEESKKKNELKEFILRHPELRFVSLSGVDFLGNDTDERIPIEHFLKNLEDIFAGGVQTDGSSVNLPGIATLNDAKIDFIIDFHRKWFIDYNYEYMYEGNVPVGTIRIPIYFKHHEQFYCSRSLMKNSLNYLKETILEIISNDTYFLSAHNISSSDIKEVFFTLGTELEFWVSTPLDSVSKQELAVTQMLKESYWKRTNGQIRTCLEKSLLLLQEYGFEPEMGHKEVGGVKGKISPDGKLFDVMEQLEIDWRFDEPMQAADNELFARTLIKEVFRRHGLQATFIAKPVEGVAGNGEHMHIGIGIKLKDGRKINILAPTDKEHFLSNYGYGALMGLLKYWRYVNPFVSHSNSALKRLQPGFEAPVCTVASLGNSPTSPSRNRTVLAGLVRSDNPLSVRFEVRAPNPHTNTYLAVSAFFISMLDGMKYAQDKNPDILHRELNKKRGEDATYLSKDLEYISEDDIFEDMTEKERTELYGKSPRTVWEVITPLKDDIVIFKDTPINPQIIHSFYLSALNKWVIELTQKEIPNIQNEIKQMHRHKDTEGSYDAKQWDRIEKLRREIAKDTDNNKSLLNSLYVYISEEAYSNASDCWLEIREKFNILRQEYAGYIQNII